MDVVSGAFAVLSLGIQLAESVKKANTFLKDVQKAPDELMRLVETLDQLAALLIQVDDLIEQQQRTDGLLGPSGLLQSALQSCRLSVGMLEVFVNKLQVSFDRQGRVKKVWASLKTVVKKEDTERLRGRIHENMTALQSALLINMSFHQLQIVTTQHQTKVAARSACSTVVAVVNDNDHLQITDLAANKKSQILRSEETSVLTYWGVFGSIMIRRKAKFLGNSRSGQEAAISQETSVLLRPSFVCKAFELRYRGNFGILPNTLSYFPVLPGHAKVFKWCEDGRIEDLKNAFSRREISPFVQNEKGETLLHYASNFYRGDLCLLLIQLGIDPNHVSIRGDKALYKICKYRFLGIREESAVDTMKVLTSAQDEVTSDDVFIILQRYVGSFEALDYLLSTFVNTADMLRSSDMARPPLSMALWHYGLGFKEWGGFIRKLIQLGADIHAGREPWGYSANKQLTPLDEIFYVARDPFDDSAIQEWLTMLAEAGYDVRAYIEEEIALHDGPTVVFMSERQLCFRNGDSPRVWWDWWIDPSSAASLVCEEFRHMNRRGSSMMDECEWKASWPFVYHFGCESSKPDWWKDFDVKSKDQEWIMWHRKRKLTQTRFERRARKRFPRHKDNTERFPMPGIWVEEDSYQSRI